MRTGYDLSAIGFRLFILTILSIGCVDGTGPAFPVPPPAPLPAAPAPLPSAPPVAAPASAAPRDFPPLARPGVIYRAPDSLYGFEFFGAMHGSDLASRYVLYGEREFGLQFASLNYPFFEYTGNYSRADSVLTFFFDGDSRWQATGILRGDSLFVSYNLIASMSDFMDGVYVRSPAQ